MSPHAYFAIAGILFWVGIFALAIWSSWRRRSGREPLCPHFIPISKCDLCRNGLIGV